MMTLVGAVGTRGRAAVDERGALRVVGADWSLDWWLGADDHWRVPARDSAVRQRPVGGAPVLETAARVPGGDARQRVYGIGGPGGLVVIEVENDSPAAFVVAFTVQGARSVGPARVTGDRIAVDGREALVLPFAPPRWTVATGTGVLVPETVGADTGAFPSCRDRNRVEAALLFPLSHRNRLRIAVATSDDPSGPVDLGLVPSAAGAAAGWRALLDHGMRVALPDLRMQEALDLARSQVLLDPDPDAATTAALEDWGHDDRAAWAWRGLSLSARRAARRRAFTLDESRPAGLLGAVRRMLVRETSALELDLAPALPSEWRGQDLDVHDVPTRTGRLSYALRWHGPRPALLWEVVDPAPGLALRASALDPAWSTTAPTGETLLA